MVAEAKYTGSKKMVECSYPKPYRSLSSQIPAWTINSQVSCILYTLLPAEIRLLIFRFVLAEEDVFYTRGGRRLFDFPEPNWLIHDLPNDTSKPEEEDADLDGFDMRYYERHLDDVSHEEQLDWLRPGSTGRRRQHTDLLRTCRQIFLETRDLLTAQTTLLSFVVAGGDRFTSSEQLSSGFMTRYTANRITSLHEYAEVFHLEDALWRECRETRVYRCIQDLRFTIRKMDWWKWETSGPLTILPYDGGGTDLITHTSRESLSLTAQMEMTQQHGRSLTRPPIPPIPFFRDFREKDAQSWGDGLSWLPNLRTLTMDFEYSEDKFYELFELAEWAQRVWTFRLGGNMKGYYLSAEGIPVKKTSWRGLATHWSRECPHNIPRTNLDEEVSSSEEDDLRWKCCTRRNRLAALGIGPRMYVFTVKWTARRLEPEDGDDPDVPGKDILADKFQEDIDDGKDIEPGFFEDPVYFSE